MILPDLTAATNTAGSLVFPEGTKCRWCATHDATTIVYDWATCIRCVTGGPKERVRAWLAANKPKTKATPR